VWEGGGAVGVRGLFRIYFLGVVIKRECRGERNIGRLGVEEWGGRGDLPLLPP